LAMAGTIPQNIEGRHGSAGTPEKRPGSAGALRTSGGLGPFRAPCLWQGDFRLALRYLALDAPPDAHRGEGGAVVLRAALQLVEQRAGLVQALARRLGRAAHVVIAGPRRLVPGLLEVGHQEHHALDLIVEVRRPLTARAE